jgi:copper chaperone CopZ
VPRTTPGKQRGDRCTEYAGSEARELGEGRAYNPVVSLQHETIKVSGIRCERCVGRLAAALRGHEGLEYANANLVGDVTLSWDETRTTRADILAALARSGFREAADDRE